MNDTLTDSVLAAGTTGVVHYSAAPTDNTTTIVLSIITGILAPLVKTLVEKWAARAKARKQAKKEDNEILH